MYAAFNVEVDRSTIQAMERPPSTGSLLQGIVSSTAPARVKPNIRSTLASMLDPDGTVNADRMREDWFPNIKCHVFLSHAHANSDLAREFVRVLESRFGITCFVDADVWGYIGDLQKEIDDRWCKNVAGKYDYEKLRASTAHVHMLLLSALAKMMDNCECLMFLNTPASVPVKDAVQPKTYSSWIYGEAALSSIIRRRGRDEHRPGAVRAHVESMENLPSFKYELPLEHMHALGKDKLLKWSKRKFTVATNALDALYELSDIHD